MSDLQAYLAAKYMSGAKADAILDRTADGSSDSTAKRRKKKRPRTNDSDAGAARASGSGSGLIIDDDDGMGWARAKADEDDDESRPVVEEKRGQFKAKASNSWSTIRQAEPDPVFAPSPEPEPVDEDPYVVSVTQDSEPPAPAPEPVPVARGGLQSASALKAEQERREAEQARKKAQVEQELAQLRKARKDRGEDTDDEEDPHTTVYRDSSGKRIDMKLARAEEAKRKRDDLEKQMKKMEWGKGLVQKGEKEQRKLEAEKLAKKGIARYADDEDMNEELRERERWNDPAANFLTKKKEKTGLGPRFPKYSGPAPAPNRFGIAPGYRWDGVDRGNGFEAMYMQKINSRKVFSAAAHAYSTEDM